MTAHTVLRRFFSIHFVSASILVMLLAISARSTTTFTWDGGGGNSNWETANNWNPNTAPGHSSGSHQFVFAGTTRLSSVANNGGWQIGSLTFASNAGAFKLSGDELMIGSGGVINNSINTQTIANQIKLTQNQTWNAASGAIVSTGYFDANHKNLTLTGSSAITIAGQLNNVGTLNLSGSGNRSFGTNQVSANTINIASTGTNTFASQITVGTLNISAGNNNISNAQVASGTYVSGAANVNFTGPVTGGGGITLNTSGNVNFSGTINSGSLTLNGSGITTISGSGSMHTGAVVVNNGTLVLNHTGGASINNSLTVNNGGTVVFGQDNQIPTWQTVTLNTGSTLYLGNTSQTFASLIINGDSVIDFGSGGSQLNITYGGISIADGITITIVNWDANAGDVFAGSDPGMPVVNVQYADSNGNIYATGTWGGNRITPGGAPIPEPGSYGLLLVGGGVSLVILRRRRVR